MLDEICERNHVTRWWNWWKVCRYHLVPALHGWGWTATNWAEIGQSCMKKNHRIWTLDALWEDILHAIVEEADWLNFTKNKGKVLGRGPTLLVRRLNEVKAMHEFDASAIEAIRAACLLPDVEKHFNPDKHFIPSAHAKHRVPSSYPKNNPTQDAANVGQGKGKGRGKGNPKGTGPTTGAPCGRGRGHKLTVPGSQNGAGDLDDLDFPPPGSDPFAEFPVYVSDSDGEPEPARAPADAALPSDDEPQRSALPANTGKPTDDTLRRNLDRRRHSRNRHYEDGSGSESSDDELVPYNGLEITKQKEKAKIARNLPTYVILKQPANWEEYEYPYWPQKCTGCDQLFADKLYQEPLNMVFRFCTIHTFVKGGKRRTSDGPKNAYFHSIDLSCLSRLPELENVKVEDLYIEEASYKCLSDEQKKILKKCKHWNAIRRSCAKVINAHF